MATLSRRQERSTGHRALLLLRRALLASAGWIRSRREAGRQRRALSRLDDRLLRDIGITPAQARAVIEGRRPR